MHIWLGLLILIWTLNSNASDINHAVDESSCERAFAVVGDKEVHRALKKNSRRQAPTIFHPNPKKINWELAEKIILNGQIKTIVQSHNRSVLLLTANGQGFITKEPEIDRVIDVAGIIDPCHVFIGLITE
jgi:hypothetical protein